MKKLSDCSVITDLQTQIDEIELTEGPQGEQGIPGPPGADGADGINGQDGADGIDGQNGADGADGQNGVDGQDGAQGIPGVDGSDATIPADWRCEEICGVVGYVNLDVNGNPFASCGDFVLGENSTGIRTIVSAPTGAETHSVDAIVDADSRDGIHVHFDSSFTVGRISISTGDNGATADTLVNAPISIKWYGKRKVIVCDTLTPTEGGSGPVIGTATTNYVNDNCQDGGGNAPFNLQIRNQTNTADDWQMVWEDRPYATIPSLSAGPYTHSVIDNGNGTYDHVFTGTAPLGAFANVTITGGLPVPAGDGDCSLVTNYIP